MIKLKRASKDYTRCLSCFKSNEEILVFKISIGTTENQTTSVMLCENCLLILSNFTKSTLVK